MVFYLRYILSSCLILNVIYTFVQAQRGYNSSNLCLSKETCHECIQTPTCAWCYDLVFTNTSRCFDSSKNIRCSEEYIINPDNVLTVYQNHRLTKDRAVNRDSYNSWRSSNSGGNKFSDSGSQLIQVSPQKIRLQLRVGVPYTFNMKFGQAEDYPLDVYYLVQVNNKDKFYSITDQLTNTVKSLTSNFRIGFGSYVDKLVSPNSSTHSERLRTPCQDCAPQYGFRHHMSLSHSTNVFLDMVKKTNVSGTLDSSKGGLDALLQAMVCQEQIGWRKEARRVIVYLTDSSFNTGDSKLGGNVKQNDGKCHLSMDGFYNESSTQDHPSIEQIAASAQRNHINVFFAVSERTMDVYRQIANGIEGSIVVSDESSGSILSELIKELYSRISSTIQMKHNATDDVNINFFTSCHNAPGELERTNECGNIKVGDVINFEVDIEVTKCPVDPTDYHQRIHVYPVGISESLVIDLEMICECACEKPGDKHYEENSPRCSNAGTLKCGNCECGSGAYGRNCECIGNNTVDCVNPLSGLQCSDRGQCVCGQCECEARVNAYEKIYGKYCECDDFSCKRQHGVICSGPDHGTCHCGICQCNVQWTGSACECAKSTDSCYKPGLLDGRPCSGHGKCQCGACTCEAKYIGRFCETCPTCPDKCNELKDCVQCMVYNTGPLKTQCTTNCTEFVPIVAKEITVSEENGDVQCRYLDEEECKFSFVYHYNKTNKIVVKAQKERQC